jgi:hypothetical protein
MGRACASEPVPNQLCSATATRRITSLSALADACKLVQTPGLGLIGARRVKGGRVSFGSAKTAARNFGKALKRAQPTAEFDEILARKWRELDKTT